MKTDKLIGKTIKSIDTTSCNYCVVFFTDGTHVVLEADAEFVGNGMSIPILVLSDEIVTPKKGR